MPHPEQAQARSESDPRRDWPRVIRVSGTVVLDDTDSAVSRRRVREQHIQAVRVAVETAVAAEVTKAGHAVAGMRTVVDYGYNAVHVESNSGTYGPAVVDDEEEEMPEV